jgi:hypothetical protein
MDAAVLARCEKQLKDGRFAEALMTVATVRLPVTDSWTASRTYQQICAREAERLGELEHRHWRQVATWATSACNEFSLSERRLAGKVNAAIGNYKSETDSLKSELDAAFRIAQVRAAQLGPHKKR